MQKVLHHTGLEQSGGATRVARLLVEGLTRRDIQAELCFEHAENSGSKPVAPELLGPRLGEGVLAHIHCTGDWIGLLSGLKPSHKTFFTLHDCELFTGGCPYPLHCAELDSACGDPCPRGFGSSFAVRKQKHQLLDRLDPVLVAPSRWLARLAKSHLFRAVHVIPNGIPWPDAAPSKRAARAELGIHPAAKVVLFAAHGGTGAAYKSGETWRDIWHGIKQRVPDAICFAVGGDTAAQEGDLFLWPYVDRAKLALLMTAADILLYPTRADNHSLVILEAMSCGLPIVAYGVGGVSEQVIHEETGVIVPEADIPALVQAAADLLGSATRIREYGHLAFELGSKRFTLDRMVADYIALYERFL